MSQKLTPEQRQKALDEITPEDREKIAGKQSQSDIAVSPEWMLLAEFGMMYGWQAYLDAKTDARDDKGNLLVTGSEMMTLITAGRKIIAGRHYDDTVAAFIGSFSSRHSDPGKTFSLLTKDIIKSAKVDE